MNAKSDLQTAIPVPDRATWQVHPEAGMAEKGSPFKNLMATLISKVHPRGISAEQAGKAEASIEARVPEAEPVHESEEAVEYEKMVRRHYWILNGPFVRMLARHDAENARVLDIGTGPGLISLELAKRKPGWEIWALDASPDMLDLGRARAREMGVADRVHFVEGNALSLPFERGFFDLTFSHFLLHHIPKPEELFDEVVRVTRPGGRIMIKDLMRLPRWKTSMLMWFSRRILRYSPAQLGMYRESIAAALTFREAAEALGRSKLSQSRMKTFRGIDLVISGTREPHRQDASAQSERN